MLYKLLIICTWCRPTKAVWTGANQLSRRVGCRCTAAMSAAGRSTYARGLASCDLPDSSSPHPLTF